MTLAAIFDRPATNILVVAVVCVAVGWAVHWWAEYSTRPPRAEPTGDRRPDPVAGSSIEPPAAAAELSGEFPEAPRSISASAGINRA